MTDNFHSRGKRKYRQWLYKIFLEDIKGRNGAAGSDEKYEQLLTRIHAKIEDRSLHQKTKIINMRRNAVRLVAAASIIGLVITGALVLSDDERSSGPITAFETSDKKAAVIRTKTNATVDNKVIAMEDGSEVTLEPGAAISYYFPFVNNRRDVSLRGAAIFSVAKDKTQPFTVYSGGISTTALGTKFRVSDENQRTDVRLYEGRVVVRTTAQSPVQLSDVYLQAGNEFTLNKQTLAHVVKRFDMERERVNPGITENGAGSVAFSFEKHQLADVFMTLENYYHTSIEFDASQFAGTVFTGTFLKSDSLETALSVICNVNDLEFVKEGNKIIIRKAK